MNALPTASPRKPHTRQRDVWLSRDKTQQPTPPTARAANPPHLLFHSDLKSPALLNNGTRLALRPVMFNPNSSHNKRMLFAIAPWLALGAFMAASACSPDDDPAPPYGAGGSGASGGSLASGGAFIGSGGGPVGGEGGVGGQGGGNLGGDSAARSGL